MTALTVEQIAEVLRREAHAMLALDILDTPAPPGVDVPDDYERGVHDSGRRLLALAEQVAALGVVARVQVDRELLATVVRESQHEHGPNRADHYETADGVLELLDSLGAGDGKVEGECAARRGPRPTTGGAAVPTVTADRVEDAADAAWCVATGEHGVDITDRQTPLWQHYHSAVSEALGMTQ